jgi:hypothetical protein
MSQSEDANCRPAAPESEEAPKKPYIKPELRFEQVFETSALSCGKVQTTQSGCHSNRKTS